MTRVLVALALFVTLTSCAGGSSSQSGGAGSGSSTGSVGASAAASGGVTGTQAAGGPTSAAPPTISDAQLLGATVPQDSCGDGSVGWQSTAPIVLTDGKGTARNADGSFAGASITGAQVLGRADLQGDGAEDIVLSYTCYGSPPEGCCAGRTGMLTFVSAFGVDEGTVLRRTAPVITGGFSTPGDQFGPAFRRISKAVLDGGTVVTIEYIAYAEKYTAEQVGGDPNAPVTVRYSLVGGAWQAG